MRADPVTNRYAEALFRLAQSRGVLDAVTEDMRRLGAELASPAVSAFLFDARIRPSERREKIQPLVGGFHEFTQNLVSLLFDKRREEVLRGLPEAFHRRALVETGSAEGVVESARPLETAAVEEMQKALSARLGKNVTLTTRIAPDLIGGVRVTVENRMVDISLAGRLQGLRRKLMEAPLPAQ